MLKIEKKQPGTVLLDERNSTNPLFVKDASPHLISLKTFCSYSASKEPISRYSKMDRARAMEYDTTRDVMLKIYR